MLEQELKVAVDAALEAGVEVARLRRDGVRYGRKDGWSSSPKRTSVRPKCCTPLSPEHSRPTVG
ncbi:MAG: hypothetical protein IPO51_09900 [Dehalococcoidia bacterium]|nr:hypothetical protein [Dehalococcoidia bacterium]